jgi:hypothetical protein
VSDIGALIKAGFAARKGFRTWRNRVRARKGKPLKEGSMLEGKKTYLGIAVLAVGFILKTLGIDDTGAAEALVTNGAALVGGLLAIYGRYKAKPKQQ